MEREMLKRWIHNIFTTQDEEIACDQACEALSHYVEMEISGEDAASLLPDVSDHLEQCPECAESYEALLEIACLAVEDALPEADELMEDVLRTCRSLSL